MRSHSFPTLRSSDLETMFERYLNAWRQAPDEDSLLRAARLMAQGTRMALLGWMELLDEQLARPARERLLRGELERFPDDVRVTFTQAISLAPEMFTWLAARYLEHRSVDGIVEGFERFLASRGLARLPAPLGPPAIVFVDLSGFTRLTRERGDESAVRAATSCRSTSASRSLSIRLSRRRTARWTAWSRSTRSIGLTR